MTEMNKPLDQKFVGSVDSELRKGALEFGSEILENYGRDWTRQYKPQASALYRPTNTAELSHFLRLCLKHRISVVPSGGRTGLAGGAVAAHGEVIINLERFTEMQKPDTKGHSVRVQAGAITKNVRTHCETVGMTWPIYFAADGSSQIGGNIATNAGGIHVIRYGTTRSWVMGLQVVLMNGEVLELGSAVEKDNTGLNLKELFIGSEGILGIITEATLRLTRSVSSTQLLFLGLDSIANGVELIEFIRLKTNSLIRSFELMDHKCVTLVSEHRNIKVPISKPMQFYGIVELETLEDNCIEKIVNSGLIADGHLALSSVDCRNFWALRDGIGEALASRGLLHKNDISIPIGRLVEFNEGLKEVFLGLDLEPYIFGHVGDGNLHINLLKPKQMTNSEFIRQSNLSDSKLFEQVQKFGGSISAEHGIGLLKKNDLNYSRTQSEIEIMRGIKRVFDPHGLMNPGKVI